MRSSNVGSTDGPVQCRSHPDTGQLCWYALPGTPGRTASWQSTNILIAPSVRVFRVPTAHAPPARISSTIIDNHGKIYPPLIRKDNMPIRTRQHTVTLSDCLTFHPVWNIKSRQQSRGDWGGRFTACRSQHSLHSLRDGPNGAADAVWQSTRGRASTRNRSIT